MEQAVTPDAMTQAERAECRTRQVFAAFMEGRCGQVEAWPDFLPPFAHFLAIAGVPPSPEGVVARCLVAELHLVNALATRGPQRAH